MKNLLLIVLLLNTACVTKIKYPTSSTNSIPSVQVEAPSSPVPFHTEINYQWAKDLVKVANCLINKQEFINAIESIDKFDYSDKNGKTVIELMKGAKCGIRVYTTKNPWSSAIATTYASDKEYLYLNLRKNPRAMGAMVNTAIHECSHIAGFSHGDNSPVGKENSVPYLIGRKAEELVHLCN